MADPRGGTVCISGEPSPLSLERLSAFLDGDLPAADVQLVRQHVEACVACARRTAELRVLAGAVRALDAPEPPPTLWPAIAGELDGQGATSWFSLSHWRQFTVGALAGAAAVAALVGGLRGRVPAPGAGPAPAAVAALAADSPAARASSDPLLAEAEAEFARAAADYERSIEKLRTLIVREESRWSPDVRARYTERLARLDDAIGRSREAARRAPGDSLGNEQLFAAYQQKIAFLAEAVHRGDGWGPGGP
jgi:hypothetical protein